MTKEEVRFQVAVSCIQGLIEAKLGIIGEVAPEVAVKESLRIADAFVEEWYRETKEQEEDKESIEYCTEILDGQDMPIVRITPQALPQSHWKPSKKQMGALENARYMMSQSTDFYDTIQILDSLINDLKKL